MNKPLVSVLISVYNGEEFLQEAMDSVISQTFSDWECIVIDDCSNDRTAGILKEYAKRDKRIRFYRNEVNKRLPGSLNRALELARGYYVIRMDADDVCRRDRFEKQIGFMEKHPELSMSCCKIAVLRGKAWGLEAETRRDDADAVKALFLFFNPIYHNAVIARAEDMKRLGYDPSFSCTEDLELWTRMLSQGLKIAVQNEYMVLYRIHDGQTSVVHSEEQKKQYRRIISDFYAKNIFALGKADLDFMTTGIYYREQPDIRRLANMIKRIRRANQAKKVFTDEGIRYASFELMMACRSQSRFGEWIAGILSLGPFFAAGEILRRKWCRYQNRKVYQGAERWLQWR
ncbi:glycosyltransferase family 2 protein [Lacrimispora sp. 210928-DFI.3.58]|uniref:glycosyltransferase family 2 protein n=1 Tax=Lacrimispora sp. 210928-DFI.3.58 TaxID=2883214 RepID=UPI001D07461D|nr:glycosyltransferase [Lacrimispora sp. 210928-DFI.3.58]MCB7319421.1 glycosyltransferase [Lacrimispora sp. 210928-DFI.3.58]